MMNDRLDEAALNEAFSETRLAGLVRHLRVVDSTNRVALQAAAHGETMGVWIADEQTAGRGRGGHSWHSAPGEGLYVSLLYTPRLPVAEAMRISLAAGLAAQEAIEAVAGVTVDLRWPNDLVTYGRLPSRKLGGVLVETATEASLRLQPRAGQDTESGAGTGFLRHAVVGIGINVSHREFPPELASLASSLRLEGWRSPDRQALALALLEHLDRNLLQLERRDPADDLYARLERASTWMRGKPVQVAADEAGGDGGYTGVTEGLDSHGFLRVRTADGARHTVRSGGVREALDAP